MAAIGKSLWQRMFQIYNNWRQKRSVRLLSRAHRFWLKGLLELPPAVFVGADVAYGGVRGHIRGIRRYSSLKVQIVPDEDIVGKLSEFSSEMRNQFMDFDPIGQPAVHSHVEPWMIRWCRRQQKRGLRWVHTYHLPYFPEHGNGCLLPWQDAINHALIYEACNADVRISVSKWQQDYLHSKHHIKTIYLPNGVDVEACDQGDANRFRSKHALKKPFILFVGRNTPVKNPADFVRLSNVLSDKSFVMLGEGTTRARLISDWELIIGENLLALGGASHNEVQDALAACSALVVTSRREGLPTLVLEAMAHQTPVIVPDEDGCMEAIGYGDFGWIYRHGDISDLAEKTLAALNDRKRMLNSRQRVLDEYQWVRVAERLDRIYRS